MALTEGERVLYARQLLLAEFGPEAHERMAQTQPSLAVDADGRARAAFALYAARAGLGRRPDLSVCTETENGVRRAVLPNVAALDALAGSPERAPAVALICGAFAATAAVFEAAGVPACPAHLEQLSVLAEEL
jgi:hypothetical protein